MTALRALLALMALAIVAYTSVTISLHGWNLLPVFFGDMAQLTWPGQFNLDFFTFLLLSGVWLAWRHHFSLAGLALAVVAVFGGMLFLSVYLLLASFKANGDVKVLLLGARRAAAFGVDSR
jgi:hypothetical protein